MIETAGEPSLEIALCDDDPSITGFLEAALKDCAGLLPETMHIQVFHRGAAVLAALKRKARGPHGGLGPHSGPFDIIFLDIELGDTTGIAVAEQIRAEADQGSDADPVLVFVSAYESYCKQLFRYHAAAFLSKPIDRAEVRSTLLRVYKELRNPRQVFVYKSNDDMFLTHLADILYFESKLRKIEMVTKDGVKSFYGKLDEVEAQIKHPGFIRTHNSMLVNLDNVRRIEKNTLFFPGGLSLILVRGRIKELRNKISDYYAGTGSAGAPPPPEWDHPWNYPAKPAGR
jgi:DNA-binding LytR/AlgR family response regulator